MQSPNKQPRSTTFGRVFLFLFLCALILATVSRLLSQLPPPWPALTIGAVASLATFALTAIFLRWNALRLKDAGAGPTITSGFRLAAGFLIGLFLAVFHLCLVVLVGHVRLVRAPGVAITAAIIPLLTYLALACREELAFHGYALRQLEHQFGLWAAQFVIAMVFALEHVLGGLTWMHAVFGAAIGSLLFGMAALATRGLAVPIGMHAAWNFGQWVLGAKESSGLWQEVAEQGSGGRLDLAVSLSYLIVFVSGIAVFWWIYRRVPQHSEMPSNAASATR